MPFAAGVQGPPGPLIDHKSGQEEMKSSLAQPKVMLKLNVTYYSLLNGGGFAFGNFGNLKPGQEIKFDPASWMTKDGISIETRVFDIPTWLSENFSEDDYIAAKFD